MADMEDGRTDRNGSEVRITGKRDADSMNGAETAAYTGSAETRPDKRQRRALSSSTIGSNSSSAIGDSDRSSGTDYSAGSSDKENQISDAMPRSNHVGVDVPVKLGDRLMESARTTVREEIYKKTEEEVNRIYASLPSSSRVKMIDNHLRQSDETLANHHENMNTYLRYDDRIEQSVRGFAGELSNNSETLRVIKAAEGIVKGKAHNNLGLYSEGSLSRTNILMGHDSRSDIDANHLRQKLSDFQKSDDYKMRTTKLEERDRKRTRPGR